MQEFACVTVLVASVDLTVKVSALSRRLNATCTSVQLHIPHIYSHHCMAVLQLVHCIYQ